MHQIFDLEHLLLISHIAQKWNRAKTFVAAISFSPKNHFLLKNESFLKNDKLQENFARVNQFGGAIFLIPPFNNPNPVSSRYESGDFSRFRETSLSLRERGDTPPNFPSPWANEEEGSRFDVTMSPKERLAFFLRQMLPNQLQLKLLPCKEHNILV